jgi:hypothetical protein
MHHVASWLPRDVVPKILGHWGKFFADIFCTIMALFGAPWLMGCISNLLKRVVFRVAIRTFPFFS